MATGKTENEMLEYYKMNFGAVILCRVVYDLSMPLEKSRIMNR